MFTKIAIGGGVVVLLVAGIIVGSSFFKKPAPLIAPIAAVPTRVPAATSVPPVPSPLPDINPFDASDNPNPFADTSYENPFDQSP